MINGKIKGPGIPDGTGPYGGTEECQLNKNVPKYLLDEAANLLFGKKYDQCSNKEKGEVKIEAEEMMDSF